MRRIVAIAALGTLCLATNAATAQRSNVVDLSCYSHRDGKPDWKAIQSAYERGDLQKACFPPKSVARDFASSTASSAAAPLVKASTKTVLIRTPPDNSISSVKFVLRKDFSDIDLFTAVSANSEADGAELSWTRDRTAKDTIWSADGVAAIAYSYITNNYSSVVGFAVAPYAKFNEEFHSNPDNSDTNVVTAGGSGEIGIHNILGLRGVDYFRARWARTDDRVANTRADQVTGEWIPTYLRLRGEIPGTRLIVNFRPELMVQYDRQADGLPPSLFSGQQQALRVGPEATLKLNVLTSGLSLPAWLETLASLTGTVTYHWWTETYSHRNSSWLTTALTYNLDKDGNVALSASYKRGMIEETGKQADIVKISLTAKTCAELLAASAC
jgi:hypothetical protein